MNQQEMLREVIREVVRDVIREVIAEEMAAAMATVQPRPTGAAARRVGPTPAAAPSGESSVLSRGALTERHVRAVGKGGRVVITTAVVVTPLAKERAKAMGVEIVRIDG